MILSPRAVARTAIVLLRLVPWNRVLRTENLVALTYKVEQIKGSIAEEKEKENARTYSNRRIRGSRPSF